MNKYGAILDDFGFSKTFDDLINLIINPLSKLFYPHISNTLDGHHGFIVSYELGKDVKLDFHVDDSEVTINACLGKNFMGGDLYFGGIRCYNHQQRPPKPEEEISVSHTPGTAILHLGKHRHAARRVISGERHNLIVWCRSSIFRESYNDDECENWCGDYGVEVIKHHNCNCGDDHH